MKFTKGYMLLLFFLAALNALSQEGTKQLMPSSTDRLYLMLNHNDHPNFAMYGCDEDVRLNIYLKAGERLYFGMQLNAEHHFRIKEEDGDIIFGEQATPDSGDAGYIADYDEATSGPEGVKLNGDTISESEGYIPLSFTAEETGNHYIEFDDSNTKTHIHFIDFTVTDADDNIITNPTNPNQSAGRLWSKNWVMTTTSFDEYPVNTYFYVFTGDEFVNKVKFDMKPYGFDFVSNSNGLPTGSNHALKKAQSKDGKITISNGYKIFLNDPDQSVFKNTKLPPPEAKVWIDNEQIYDYDYTRDPQLLNFDQDTVTIEKNGDPDCAEDDLMLFKIQSNIDGFTRIYLDIDGNGFSDNSTQDTLLQKEIFEGTNYITWDFKDKAGNEVADGTYSASATFLGRGPAHFPLYDVETLSNVEALSIRPFNKLGPTLYWDDTPVDNAGQWGDNTGNMDNTQVNQLQNGASVPRIWTYENGFDNGDENSMNTWFNAIDLGMKTIDLKVASTDTCKEGDAPIVADTYKDTTVNTTVDFTAYDFERKFFDPADQTLDKIKVLSLPDNGTLNLDGNAVSVNDEISQENLANLTFDPDTDWTGETSFKWEASNGTAYSRNTDFVYITINTPPTIENIDNQYVCADQKLSDLSFTIGDAETDASELQLRAYSHNLNLVENSNISFGGSGQNRTISVTPNAGVTGSAIIYIEVSDGHSSTIGDFNLFIGPDLTFQGDTTLCTGSDLSITASEPNADTYEWTLPDDSTVNGRTLSISSGNYDLGTYALTIAKGGCSQTREFEVTTNPTTTFTGDTMACEGGTIELTAEEQTADEYKWTNEDNSIEITNKTLTIKNLYSDSVGTYTLYVDKDGCQAESDSFSIEVAETPDNTLTTTGSTVEAGNDGTVTVENSETDITYQAWLDGSEVSSNTGDGSDLTLAIDANDLVIGDNTVEIYANAGGCQVQLDNATVHVNPPKISIDSTTITEGNAGTTEAELTVSLSYYSQQTIEVDYNTGDNTATTGDNDYESQSGTITFNPGEKEATVNIPVHGDKKDENDESFTVTLSNASNASLANTTGVVTIINDDHSPLISDQTVSIAESADNETEVYDVDDDNTSGDTDADGQDITYSIAAGNTDNIFAIDASTGQITVSDNTNLDYETTDQYQLNVEANDSHGNSDQATVTINIANTDDDVNLSVADESVTEGDNETVEMEFTISASIDAAFDITVDYATSDETATSDADYNAVSGQATIAAGSSSETIAVTVKGDKLDEDDETFKFTISNNSAGTITDAEAAGTIIDDDHSPLISDQTVSIPENADNETEVYDVDDDNTSGDTDADGQDITYSITGGNTDNIFAIDASTGQITVSDNTNLDYETTSSYSLTVQAEDPDANTDEAVITVNITDVNENSPAISDATASIAEDAANGTNVYNLDDDSTSDDTDADGQDITYSITGGNTDNIFAIDASTGQITVSDNASLDYETSSSYSLTVHAEDPDANTDEATITVNITNVNENSPAISDATAIIPEDAAKGTDVYNLDDDNTSGDIDDDGQDITYSITGGNTDNIFAIDASTGQITVSDNTSLDYETTRYYSLTVQAEDLDANTDEAVITVNIADVNESPEAIADSYTYEEGSTNSESTANGVLANDSDPDGDAITAILVSDVSNGNLTLNSDGSFEYTHDGSETSNDQFSYKVNDGKVDGNTVTVDISIIPVNHAPVAKDDTGTLQRGGTITINVLANDTDQDGDINPATLEIMAMPQSSAGVSIADSSITVDFGMVPEFTGNDRVVYEVADDAGNSDQGTVYLTVHTKDQTLNIPDSFSPNGDGINDRFVIPGIKEYTNNELIIFNRWGNEVYRRQNYQNEWDGSASNRNKKLPVGTYYYILHLKNRDKTKNGYIYLTR